MKKQILTIILALSAVLCLLAGCLPSVRGFDIDKVHHIYTGDDAELHILAITDVMFDGSNYDVARQQMITSLVERTVGSESDKNLPEYEFIVVNGNTVNGNNNGELMQKAVSFFDGFGIPWAITLGKYDVVGEQSKTELMNILKTSTNGVMSKATYYDEANYLIDVFNENDKFISTLYFIDTSVPCTDELIVWYSNTVKTYGYEFAEKSGKNANSTIFMNTPLAKLNEHESEWDKVDPVTVWEDSANFEKEIINLESSRGVFVGLDTMNDYAMNVTNNIRWSYIKSLYFPTGVDIESKEFEAQANENGGTRIKISKSTYVETSRIKVDPRNYIKNLEA